MDSKTILLNAGVQPTSQRIIILDYLRNSKEHLSCNQIYQDLLKLYPVMNLTTIYNTIHLLVEKNIIGELHMSDEFIYGIKDHNHGHFICKNCNKVIDFDYDLKANLNNDYVIQDTNIVCFGYCSNCKEE